MGLLSLHEVGPLAMNTNDWLATIIIFLVFFGIGWILGEIFNKR